MERVRAYFEKHAREGITLSARQLADFCRKKGIRASPEKLRRVRHEFKFTAFYSRYRKPMRYARSSFAHYGVVMADMANFMPKRRRVNGGNKAFLCAVECLSGQLAAVPVKDLTRRSWESALKTVIEKSGINAVRTVVTDRDSAVVSDNETSLRKHLRDKFGVGWHFLKSRNKAFKVRLRLPPVAARPQRPTAPRRPRG